ncbi:hypothetical protein I4U23_031473 [Adineta vaga]|nr:hypothetical protein I4U23_031473 [Adineta vaga]
MERSHLEIDHKRVYQVQMLTADYFKVTNRFHLRSAIEFIRENKLRSQPSSTVQLPIDELLEMLLKEESFYNEFNAATKDNNLNCKDTRRALIGLYHSLSQHAHGTNTFDNI